MAQTMFSCFACFSNDFKEFSSPSIFTQILAAPKHKHDKPYMNMFHVLMAKLQAAPHLWLPIGPNCDSPSPLLFGNT